MFEDMPEEAQLVVIVCAGLVTIAGLFRCVARSQCVAMSDEEDRQ